MSTWVTGIADVGPVVFIALASSSWFPNAVIDILASQTTNFFGSIADCLATASQYTRDVLSPPVPQLQSLKARVAATVSFIQTIVEVPHCSFNFGGIRFHTTRPDYLLTLDEWIDFLLPEGYLALFILSSEMQRLLNSHS